MKQNAPDRADNLFASWLARRMRAAGMNQSELATAVGVSTSTVSRWLSGRRPEAAYAETMADALNLDVDEVLTMAGYRPPDRHMREDDPATRICSLVKRVRLTEDRAVGLESTLRGWIGFDRSHRKAGDQSS